MNACLLPLFFGTSQIAVIRRYGDLGLAHAFFLDAPYLALPSDDEMYVEDVGAPLVSLLHVSWRDHVRIKTLQ